MQRRYRLASRTLLQVAISFALAGAIISGSSGCTRTVIPSEAGDRQPSLRPGFDAPTPLQRISHDGRSRTYYVVAPTKSGNGKRPLVVVLHGGTRTADDVFRRSNWAQRAKDKGFVLLAPNAIGGNWNDGREIYQSGTDVRNVDDVGFLVGLVDKMIAEKGVDPDRIYFTGASNGGNMTWRIACERPGLAAAIGPVISTMIADVDQVCARARATPVIAFYGTEDRLMRYDGGSVRTRDGRTTEPRLSAPATTDWWARRNGCSTRTVRMELPDSDRDDGTTAVRIDYLDCPANREVIRYDIVGGGHNAPGSPPAPAQLFRLLGSSNGDISAEALIWDFFNRHPGR